MTQKNDKKYIQHLKFKLSKSTKAIDELVDMLEECSTLANAAISSTPTSDYRNLLCDINIKRLAILAKYEGDK
jgi:hypothetical protein